MSCPSTTCATVYGATEDVLAGAIRRGLALWQMNTRNPPDRADPNGIANAGVGHEEQYPRPRLSGRCRFGEATFAGVAANEKDAPTPAVHGITIGRLKSTLLRHWPLEFGASAA